MMKMFEEMFGKKLPIIGVVHLQPLPGAPRYEGMAMKEISRIAVEEATIMVENGIDGLIVENFRDMMFKKRVGPETVAAMTYIAFEVSSRLSVPIGLCVLQSDAISALAIAKAVGGKFIRVPYYTETYIVDAGTMESVAADALRFRKMIEAGDVKIFADVHIKHGYSLSRRSIEESAEDAYERGLADAIIVTGKKTGGKTKPEDVEAVRNYLPDVPLIVGSGVTQENLSEYFPKLCDAVIVGTSLKKDGKTEGPIDPERVRQFSKSMEKCRKELDR
jgi:membrane complex biogenesis BtpA family protein